MSTAIVTHKDCILHDPGLNHPENQNRLISIFNTIKNNNKKEWKWINSYDVDLNNIYLVHSKNHLQDIKKNIPIEGSFNIDPDTILSPDSLKSAFKAVASVCNAVDLNLKKKFSNAFCPIRPPGHHAEPNKAMGFCLFNNIAIAAYYAKLKFKLDK